MAANELSVVASSLWATASRWIHFFVGIQKDDLALIAVSARSSEADTAISHSPILDELLERLDLRYGNVGQGYREIRRAGTAPAQPLEFARVGPQPPSVQTE